MGLCLQLLCGLLKMKEDEDITLCLLKSTKKCLLLATPSSSMYVSGVHVLKGLVGAGIHCGLSRTLGGTIWWCGDKC